METENNRRQNMRKKKIIVSILLMLCISITAMLGSVTEVQAASYKKKITKTVTIKRGKQCVLMMQTKMKNDKSVKVKVTASGKAKGMKVQAVMPGNYIKSDGYLKNKKVTLTPYYGMGKGIQSIYVSNYGSGKVKVKITVTSKYKNLKYKSCKTQSAEG